MASKGKRRKIVPSECRAIIAKVYHFLKDEYTFSELYKEPNCDLSHLRNITKRTAEATGSSTRTVQTILREERDLPSGSTEFPIPLADRLKRPTKTDIDARVAYTVRSIVRDYYVVRKKIPTVQKVSTSLNERIGFTGCPATIRKILLRLGYTWTKCDTGRRALIEKHSVQMSRLQYLKKITEYRSEGRPIVYTDESYVTTKSVKANTTSRKASRYVLAHAGTKDGFIDNACLLYRMNNAGGDENAKMNFDYYKKWLDENLLPNLPNNAVIVLDSTSFQCRPCNTLPTMHADKSEMQAWLTFQGIDFNAKLRQVELYDLIKQHKSTFTTYKIDTYIKSKGIEVLRLPPHHPELNAMLSIWEAIKNHIVTVDHDYDHTEKVIQYCADEISVETWRSACDLVLTRETEYLEYFDTGYVLLAKMQDEKGENESEEEESDSDNADDDDDDEKSSS